MPQPVHQLVEPTPRFRIRLRLGRIGVHDQIQAALEVVEHRDFLAQHQQRVGRTELVGLLDTFLHRLAQARLDPADRLEAEVADQSTCERRQFGHARYAELRAQQLDFCKWICELAGFDHLAVLADFQRVVAECIDAFRRQPDDRIAPPGLATFDRLEQIGVRAVGKLEIHRQWRVEIGQHLAHHRDAVMAGGGELVEAIEIDHGAARDEKRTEYAARVIALSSARSMLALAPTSMEDRSAHSSQG